MDETRIKEMGDVIMPLAQLPSSTVKLIGSSQVITSVFSVVKELMENAIDAGAMNINIKLEKHGLEKVEVKDDGSGICRSDTSFMCLPHYTSKITDFSDLSNLHSYGFRGEALSSLCAVAQVSVTTKTAEDDIAMCYTLDSNGQVRAAKVSQILKGTIVTVTDLFKFLPVRKQLMSSSRRASEELKKVETVVKSLAVIHPRLRVTLVHNKFMIWQKTSVSNLRQSVSQVVSQSIIKQLHYLHYKSELLKMEILVPKRDGDIATVCISSASESNFVFINSRPIHNKIIEKVVVHKILNYFGHYIPTNKYPIYFISLILPQDTLDVNLEPNKTKILIQNQEQVLDCINEQLSIYYQKTQEKEKSSPIDDNHKTIKRQKLDLVSTSDNSKKNDNSEKIQVNSVQFQDIQNVDVSNDITQYDQVLIPSNIESENCVNNILDVNMANMINDSDSQEATHNETHPHALKDKINHYKIGSTYFSATEMDFSESKKLEEFDGIDLKINDNLNEKNIVLLSDTNISCNNKNLQLNSLLETTKTEDRRSNRTEVVKQFVESLITDSKEHMVCRLTNQEKTNVLVDNNSHCNVVNRVPENDTENFINETPTLSQWSRGEVGFDCDPIQVVKSSSNDMRCKKNMTSSSISSTSIMDHSVASQMGQKEMGAFTKFARDMRSKILEETPGMTFTKVAGELANKWRSLQDEEKHMYEEEATRAEKEKKQKKLQNISITNVQKSNLLSFIKPEFKRPSIELEFSVNDLKKMYDIQKDIDTDYKFGLINQLEASSLWVYYNGCNLKIISSPRLREAVTFHRNLAEVKIPLKPSEKPLEITSLELDPTLWKLLMSLESQNYVMTDSRITHNGFSIHLIHDTDLSTKAIITHVALNIKYYGLEDLCELLKLIEVHGINCPLSECRPLKVTNFIRNEAFRECCSQEMVSDLSSMKELLFYWLENVQPFSEVCLHDNPVSLILQ